MLHIKKLVMAGFFVAIGVVCSPFYIPLGVAKCFPVQHMLNVVAGVVLGPWYALGMAFGTSSLRLFMGTGTFLAFPGSMIGALLCGLMYRYTKRIELAFLGEVVGTGLIGALAAYPVAVLLMGRSVALYGFVVPFSISSVVGASVSLILLKVLIKSKVLEILKVKEA